jgi:hypothetical protein
MIGSPIFKDIDGELQVIGIHAISRQRKGTFERGGIKLDQNMLKYL